MKRMIRMFSTVIIDFLELFELYYSNSSRKDGFKNVSNGYHIKKCLKR